MSTLLAEQPLIVTLMLAAVAIALLYGWLQTGKRGAAIGGLVFAALIPVAWWIAAAWKTDREQIEALIYEIADAVERNDHDAALAVISNPQTKAAARSELQNWEFDLAEVNKIRSIDIVSETFPPQADVDMSVKVDVGQRNRATRFRIPRRLLLRFQREDDQWKVIDYKHMPITGGPDAYSNSSLNE